MDKNTLSGKMEKNTVIICQDDANLSSFYQQALGPQYNIILVYSGAECISRYIDEKVKGNQIDILILDYELHDLPGDIVATTIRDLNGSRPRTTNTILISAYDVDEEVIENLKRKDCIIENLKKPVSLDMLRDIIQRTVT